jgi:hypothetical protein
MKNIHVLPTDKPSRLFKFANELHLDTIPKDYYKKYNIYITSDEEIKEGDWGLSKLNEIILFGRSYNEKFYKKIILTTDQDLIADGVQAIDDEFLQWFVKNPSCESVEIVKEMYMPQSNGKISDGKITHELSLNPSDNTLPFYKIIIPQEEPKQETLEEAAANLADPNICKTDNWIAGAKWQSERMYSEAIEFAEWIRIKDFQTTSKNNWIGLDMRYYTTEELFEQFKKKD